jgi:hypothetical protein
MLGIGCPDRHAFLFMRSTAVAENAPTASAPSRESGFVLRPGSAPKADQAKAGRAGGQPLLCFA